MEGINEIEVSKLRAFPDNPFKVADDIAMEMLTDSIKEYGILTPLLVRPCEDGYEVISGHRRITAAIKAGIDKVPAFIREMDKDESVIAFVDSNLTREKLLPSEKAFAYKMKLEAVKRQMARGDQVGHKDENKRSVELLSDVSSDSKTQIQRYIRLTRLNNKILEMVDEGKIAFTPAVALSYLSEKEQNVLVDVMESEAATPSLSQAVRMKKLSSEGKLDANKIFEIISEIKGNQRAVFKIPEEKIKKYFKPNATKQEIENTIIKILDDWYKRRMRKRDDRDR